MPYIGKGANGFGIRERYRYSASGSQTAFTGSDLDSKTLNFDSGSLLDVYLNGVLLDTADYNTSTANTVTLTSGATASDEVMIVVYDVFSLSDAMPKTGGTFTGGITGTTATFSGDTSLKGNVIINEDGASKDFRVEGDTNTNLLLVDGSADRVGINTSSPDAKLDVEGTTDAEVRITRTTASISGASTDKGSVLNLVNEVEFENGYDGNAYIGQLVFTANDDSTGTGVRAKIALRNNTYYHAERLQFHVSPPNTTTDQASASNHNGLAATMYRGTESSVFHIGKSTPHAWGTGYNEAYLAVGKSMFIQSTDNSNVRVGEMGCNWHNNGTARVHNHTGHALREDWDTYNGGWSLLGGNGNAGASVSWKQGIHMATDGRLFFTEMYDDTTSSFSANMYIHTDGVHQVLRSTSSGRYKKDIETLEDKYADAILGLRPVWYKSKCEVDNPDHSHWGFIAEEVAEVDPRLVTYRKTETYYDEEGRAKSKDLDEPIPEGVNYDRIIPHLLNICKRQEDKITALEARIKALEEA